MLRLLRQVHITDPSSSHHGHILDLLLDGGQIAAIAPKLDIAAAEVIEVPQMHVSPGWCDIGAWVGDPGYEHREDFHSLAQAAARGGYTDIAIWPNTCPVVDSKAEVRYVHQQQHLPVRLHPIGALTRGCQGKEITEMHDMRHAGAIAFSDGLHPVQHAGVMLRAMQYVLPFDGLIVNRPFDPSMVPEGQIHEGEVSTLLGLKGIPTLSEVLMLQRDIHLLRYTSSRLLVYGVSSAASIEWIRRAKAEGLRIWASVPIMNLLYTEEDVRTFDTRFKVLPPLRSATDRAALRQALRDGTIDCVVSNHLPVAAEHKEMEFAFADFGASTIQTVWQALRQAGFSIEMIPELLAHRPREILGLPPATIEESETANLVCYTPHTPWTLDHSTNRSKSLHSPWFAQQLTGHIRGIVRGNAWMWLD